MGGTPSDRTLYPGEVVLGYVCLLAQCMRQALLLGSVVRPRRQVVRKFYTTTYHFLDICFVRVDTQPLHIAIATTKALVDVGKGRRSLNGVGGARWGTVGWCRVQV